jgi:hypothetical protein
VSVWNPRRKRPTFDTAAIYIREGAKFRVMGVGVL